MEFPVSLIAIFAGCGVIFAGSVMQAATGLGAGLLMAPVLLLIDPVYVPGPVLLSSLSLTVPMTMQGRAHIYKPLLGPLVIGIAVGAAIAAAVIGLFSGPESQVLFGVLLLIAVGISVAGVHLKETRGTFFWAGVISAFIGTIAAVGAAVLALLYQHHEGPAVRATLALLYTLACLIMVGALAVVGRFGAPEALAAVALIPGWVLGYKLAGPLARYLDAGHTRTALLLIAAGCAVFLIARNGLALLA